MKAQLITVFFLLAQSACVASWADQLLTTKRQSFSAAGLTNVRIEAAGGELTITGRRGASTVDVIAEYRGRTSSKDDVQRIIDNLKLTMEVRGNTFYLKSETGNWNWESSGSIDLSLTIPAGLALDVEDGSGSVTISGLDSNVTIEDGSGEVNIDGVRGSLKIRDGSGSVQIRNVDKAIEITDGSGSIDISRAGGDVVISDGSGSIEVVDVAGRFEVSRDGSGSISHRDVRGEVNIPNKRRHRSND